MTTTDLAAALLRDVKKYALNINSQRMEEHWLGKFVEIDAVLAALTAALDGVDERATEMVAKIKDYTYRTWDIESLPDLITALLAQIAALRAERDALERQLSNVEFEAQCEAEDKRDAAFSAAEWQRKAEAREGECEAKSKIIADLEAKLAEWQASQHYSYIGKDGKPVLARDLEARLEAAEAVAEKLRGGRK